MKLHFDTDYMRGSHPRILERLCETNMLQTPGYGSDEYTENARRLIRQQCGTPEATVFFMMGGTQTNATVIDGILKRNQGVVCADSGHINVHEAGAIEATGHKVITVPGKDGKIDAKELDELFSSYYADETYQHMVEPAMVYISYPTEFGTLYSLSELRDIRSVCQKYNASLYLDGARLGYGLAAQSSLTLQDIACLCDIFYIGGTKVGALFGEAVVIPRNNLISPVLPLVKQHGALLAKGRLLGIQFETLFTDGLYLTISRHAVEAALKLKDGFIDKGYKPFIDSPTNQQFFRLPNKVIDKLLDVATFEFWGPRGMEFSTVRFVTDWATDLNDVKKLLNYLEPSSESSPND